MREVQRHCTEMRPVVQAADGRNAVQPVGLRAAAEDEEITVAGLQVDDAGLLAADPAARARLPGQRGQLPGPAGAEREDRDQGVAGVAQLAVAVGAERVAAVAVVRERGPLEVDPVPLAELEQSPLEDRVRCAGRCSPRACLR